MDSVSITLLISLLLTSLARSVEPSTAIDSTFEPPITREREENASPCSYKFSGKRDIIILVDVSGSVSGNNVRKAKSFLTDFIRNTLVLDADNAQLSVVVFSGNSTVEIELTPDSGYLHQCDLFLADGLWNASLLFKEEEGNDITAAFRDVLQEAEKGKLRRPSAQQNVIIISDAHEMIFDSEFDLVHKRLHSTATVYGLGTGVDLERDVFIKKILNSQHCFRNLSDYLNKASTYAMDEQNGTNANNFHPMRKVIDAKHCNQMCTSCICYDFTSDNFKCLSTVPIPATTAYSQRTDLVIIPSGTLITLALAGCLAGAVSLHCCQCRVRTPQSNMRTGSTLPHPHRLESGNQVNSHPPSYVEPNDISGHTGVNETAPHNPRYVNRGFHAGVNQAEPHEPTYENISAREGQNQADPHPRSYLELTSWRESWDSNFDTSEYENGSLTRRDLATLRDPDGQNVYCN